MKLSCEVIRDLLPLYAEGLASADSVKLVDEHLCGCDECTNELATLKKPPQVPAELDTHALNMVKKSIVQRRILAVTMAVCVVVTLALGGALVLDATIYLTAEQAVESVEALEDGSIRVSWTDLVIGTGSLGSGNRISNEPTGNFGIIAHSNLLKILFTKPRLSYSEQSEEIKSIMTEEEYNTKFGTSTYRIQLEVPASSQNFWYCSAKDGRAETLLWDAGNPYPDAPLGEVNYHLAYYCGGLAAIAAALAALAWVLRKKRAGRYLVYGAVLAACVSLSTVICCAGQLMELWGEFTEHSQEGLLLAVPMFAAAACAVQLLGLRRRDKTI